MIFMRPYSPWQQLAVFTASKTGRDLMLIAYLADSHHSTADIGNSSCCRRLWGALANSCSFTVSALQCWWQITSCIIAKWRLEATVCLLVC